VHAIPGRQLEDLGDAVLLLDPVDPEPFWNRLEALRWPSDPDAFDRRLTEASIRFAGLARQPHAWVSPPHDEPPDLAARLAANGFENAGEGCLMVVADPAASRTAVQAPRPGDVAVHRFTRLQGAPALDAAERIVSVLVDAFLVDDVRRAAIVAETLATLADARFTHYLVTVDGVAAAAAPRATFDSLSYLSSIGTSRWARGRGLGRLVTASATLDGLDAGSDWAHLGVFADNDAAIALYRSLGYELSGEPGPDMILTGR
jgi:ribosomal protein S18 acetylase RimI-like enzyme